VAETDTLADFILEVQCPSDSTGEELDNITRQLRTELLETEVSSVDFIHGPGLPEGAKGGWSEAAGTLIMSLLPRTIPKLLETLKGWSRRRGDQKLKLKTPNGLEFEFSGAMSPSDATKLLDRLLKASATQPRITR
jgi:hypothetical protein